MSKYLHAPISDVLSTVIDHRGRTPKKLGADWSESGIQVLSAMNIKAGKVDSSLSKNFIERDVFERWMPEKLKVGDILMTSEAPLGSVALLTIDREVCLGQRLFALRADKSKLDQKFFYWTLQTPQAQHQLVKRSTGTTAKGIRQSELLKVTIPLPPLEEQKRIAAILYKADAIRRKRQGAIALTKELLRSTFLDMFGDPVTNPKAWETVSMSNVISQIEAGWSAKGEERQCTSDEWGVLKISAVTSGIFNPKEHKAVGSPSFKKKPIIPKRGDLLFSRANTRELVAATCLVENDYERLFLPDKLWRIQTNPNIANVEYLRFLLADPKYRSLLARKATGTSGSMLNVSQAKLLSMHAPVPELRIQEKFADILWRIYKLKERNESSLNNLNLNFNSLQQKAFRGEL